MTKEREALKLAGKALSNRNAPAKAIYEALIAIDAALAQPEQDEPLECMCGICRLGKREPLKDEEIDPAAERSDNYAAFHAGVRFAEAAHGIKGKA